jgi:hypothetical protein
MFKLVPRAVWQIAPEVGKRRLTLLRGHISFEAIVDRLENDLRLVRLSRIAMRDNNRYHRFVLTLRATLQTVDFWHNSRGGYRAQYYISEPVGYLANSHASQRVFNSAALLISNDPRRRHRWKSASRSLRGRGAKVWIYQSLWCRRAKSSDRMLHVPRWEAQLNSQDNGAGKKAWYAGLIPEHEDRIQLIGRWIDAAGIPFKGMVKHRSRELNRYGFT